MECLFTTGRDVVLSQLQERQAVLTFTPHVLKGKTRQANQELKHAMRILFKSLTSRERERDLQSDLWSTTGGCTPEILA